MLGLHVPCRTQVRSLTNLHIRTSIGDFRRTTELTDDEIRCGIIEVAGRSIGAAFVGCVAATFVLSEVLRSLAGGPRIEVLGVTLRSPHKPQVSSTNTLEGRAANPGFVEARDTTRRVPGLR